MSNYRRTHIPGGTYFFTLVTYRRQSWLCMDIARVAFRAAITSIRSDYPFKIDAFVLLPDHLHCIWTLPEHDADYATRWRLIKTYVSKSYGESLNLESHANPSRIKRKEKELWQRRFWEHLIRDDADFSRHCDYIHYNPVKHGLCDAPEDWPYSSFHRFVAHGIYEKGWGSSVVIPNLAYDT